MSIVSYIFPSIPSNLSSSLVVKCWENKSLFVGVEITKIVRARAGALYLACSASANTYKYCVSRITTSRYYY